MATRADTRRFLMTSTLVIGTGPGEHFATRSRADRAVVGTLRALTGQLWALSGR